MTKVRTTSWGGTPVFSVDHVDDDGQLREATFFDRGEAKRFAAGQPPAHSAGRLPAADARANRAMLNRIAGRGGPKSFPRTLQGVLQRITGAMQTRGR